MFTKKIKYYTKEDWILVVVIKMVMKPLLTCQFDPHIRDEWEMGGGKGFLLLSENKQIWHNPHPQHTYAQMKG